MLKITSSAKQLPIGGGRGQFFNSLIYTAPSNRYSREFLFTFRLGLQTKLYKLKLYLSCSPRCIPLTKFQHKALLNGNKFRIVRQSSYKNDLGFLMSRQPTENGYSVRRTGVFSFERSRKIYENDLAAGE